MSQYEAKEPICPYYRFETINDIFCEGAIGTYANQVFPGCKKKEAHKRQFCNRHCYRQCPHAEEMEKKYGV